MTQNLFMACPTCGTTFDITINNGSDTFQSNKMGSEAKIEALRKAGVNVNNLFSLKGADGLETIARLENGSLSILCDDDPIFKAIKQGGTINHPRLFRRWVMAQVFQMLSNPGGFTKSLRRKGYWYQWKMVVEELKVQSKMARLDHENFVLRNRWFNAAVILRMVDDCINNIDKYIDKSYRRSGALTCLDRHSYRQAKFSGLRHVRAKIQDATDARSLYTATKEFVNKLEVINDLNNMPLSPTFIDAYKGAGAYYTLQNLIMFHGGRFFSGCSVEESIDQLNKAAEKYRHEGWRLFGIMKEFLTDNHIGIEKKMAEWRRKR